MIGIARVYDHKKAKGRAYRLLIDRLWPRGIKKTELDLDQWEKDLAPETDIRKAFAHDPKKWPTFRSAYKKQLRAPGATGKLETLVQLARKRDILLLYSAKDTEHNNAVVLKEVLETLLKKSPA